MGADTRDSVIVVSGLPRSGTSMAMQMLTAGGVSVLHDQARGADESNPRGYLEFEPVKATRKDSGWLREAPGRAVKVASLLLYDLPADYRYQVILMRRDLREVVASQRAMLSRLGRPEPAVGDALQQVYARHLAALESWLATQPNFSVLVIEHARLLQNPATAAAQIAAFLGRDLALASMAATVDPSLYRQRFDIGL